MTTVIPVVFLLVATAVNVTISATGSGAGLFRVEAVFGGPQQVALVNKAYSTTASVEGTPIITDFPIADGADGVAEFVIYESAAIFNAGNPLGTLPDRDGLIIYKVEEGDTLSVIAATFGLSLDSLGWANPGIKSKALRVGEELVILPVSGVLHQIKEGEDLNDIVNLYGISHSAIVKANPKLVDAEFPVGDNIIIPGGEPQKKGYLSGYSGLPNLNSYFEPPTTGWNWGQVHKNNAVDVANACGTTIYAAQEGLVVTTGSPLSWNSGYGGLVTIEHPNGTKTRYAHLEKLFVSKGDYVSQKEAIGTMGNTGNTHGPTGCHLHFEVAGARNPLAR